MQEKNAALESPNEIPKTEEKQNEISKEMEKSSEQLNQNNKKKASQSQKRSFRKNGRNATTDATSHGEDAKRRGRRRHASCSPDFRKFIKLIFCSGGFNGTSYRNYVQIILNI
jgi:hypothetical protein